MVGQGAEDVTSGKEGEPYARLDKPSSMPRINLALVKPSEDYLPAYVEALKHGWSPSMHEDVREDELARIRADARGFLAAVNARDDRSGLPGIHRWMWDGEFAGAIKLRWRVGTADLPPDVFGHIGYHVVPWKRRRGYATAALSLMLGEARKLGLPYVEIITDFCNVPSQRVIVANGGVLFEEVDALRFRIAL